MSLSSAHCQQHERLDPWCAHCNARAAAKAVKEHRRSEKKMSNIPTQAEYERRERQMFHTQLREVETAPLADRREARKDFQQALETPDLVAERINWLLAGDYGKGAYDAAREVLRRPRTNQVAWLTTTIAALEWRCPQKFAVEAWKKLSSAKRTQLAWHVANKIEDAKEEG